MIKSISVSFLLVFVLTGCAAQEPGSEVMVGNDRDEHGCIGSAGYSWCNKTQQCERPWELAKEEGFELSEEGWSEYCD